MFGKLIFISPWLAAMMSTACDEAAQDSRQAVEGAPLDDTFPPIEIVDVAMAGTGCSPETAEVEFMGSMLSIVFSEYQTTASPEYQAVRSCDLDVTLRVPAGLTIVQVKPDYLGFADIPGGGHGWLSRNYAWAGAEESMMVRAFLPGFSGSWMESDSLFVSVSSPCGQDFIFSANTSITAWPDDARVALDALDLNASIIFHAPSVPCSE